MEFFRELINKVKELMKFERRKKNEKKEKKKEK